MVIRIIITLTPRIIKRRDIEALHTRLN